MRNNDFRAARSRITVSVGESVKIVRELQEMTQSELARLKRICFFIHGEFHRVSPRRYAVFLSRLPAWSTVKPITSVPS